MSFRFYKDHEVRAIWSDEENKWYFSIVDIVAAITESPRPRVYWGTVKNRQKADYGQLYSKCIQLKLLAADGKHYATDCFAQEDVEEVVKTLPAKNLQEARKSIVHSVKFPIYHTLCDKLSWSHCRTLLKVQNNDIMKWYLSECVQENWEKVFGTSLLYS